jgi:hypothetical protein
VELTTSFYKLQAVYTTHVACAVLCKFQIEYTTHDNYRCPKLQAVYTLHTATTVQCKLQAVCILHTATTVQCKLQAVYTLHTATIVQCKLQAVYTLHTATTVLCKLESINTVHKITAVLYASDCTHGTKNIISFRLSTRYIHLQLPCRSSSHYARSHTVTAVLYKFQKGYTLYSSRCFALLKTSYTNHSFFQTCL